ncbi:hypothetical protein HYDPIDRAFT_29013 [Hydnomerulius pinastri MD-312]|uniref:Unplaced genomic scaffold scaffold_14, whole genome shotgun sequence n=1 Tax=Hydnomerulius pinastri MD-312 TaxID=994086 RepID=A0A0C9VF27_9AGAM|nr:hypothetical protein HYDPIDRAFT_29013 [Hydnomerulius pinastri MD-312]
MLMVLIVMWALFSTVSRTTLNPSSTTPKLVKTILPFYDDSSAPPPFPPMLTDQLELFGSAHHSSGLLADKDLAPRSRNVTPGLERPLKMTTFSSNSKAALHLPKRCTHTSSPYPKKVLKHSRASSRNRASSESPSEGSLETSDGTSDSESTLSALSEDSKISKPPGEPGRPGRGGYNLETTLDWNHRSYTKFKKFTHHLIEEHLDTTKCASAQSPVLLKVVRDKVTDAFPDLEQYSNCWPVNNMIMMHLKYTSSRAQRQELELAAGKGKKPAGRASV